jgi:hypothetical protein
MIIREVKKEIRYLRNEANANIHTHCQVAQADLNAPFNLVQNWARAAEERRRLYTLDRF